MKKIFVALMIVAGFSTQAHAWGEREQGTLAGIAGTLILQQIFRGQPVVVQGGGFPQQYPQPPVVQSYPQPQGYPMPPVIIAQPNPPQRVCDSFPQYDVYGRYYGQRTVCRHVH